MNPSHRARAAHLIPALLTVATLALASCSGTASAAEEGAGEARTIVHAMGETTVEGEPERVVVLDSPFLDALLSMDLTPVGAPVADLGGEYPAYLEVTTEQIPVIGTIQEPDVEAVAELEPDLIIGTKVRHEAVYEQLTQIAPTVFSETSGTNWEDQARLAADAVGHADEMEQLIDGVHDRAEAVGEEVGAPGTTASMVRFREDAFRLYGPETFSGSLLTRMGYELGERDWDEYSMMEIGTERYAEIDGDTVFYTKPEGDDDASTYGAVSGLWGDQPGVAAGRTFQVAEDTWMTGIGVSGANRILDDVEEQLG